MKITVKGFVSMQKYTDVLKPDHLVTVPEGAGIGNILELLKVPPDDQRQMLIFLNGKHTELNMPVKDGDSVVFFPPLDGG